MNIIIAMMSLINEDILATIIGTSPTSLLNNQDMDSQIKTTRKHKIVNTIIFDLKLNELFQLQSLQMRLLRLHHRSNHLFRYFGRLDAHIRG